MRPRSCLVLPLAAAVGALAGCGSSLSVPEDLTITTYPADAPFRISLVMHSCRDDCTEYDASSCDVDVDEKDREIRLDIGVGFERSSRAECTHRCLGEVLAHCEVPSLPSGEYTVSAGRFRRTITLK